MTRTPSDNRAVVTAKQMRSRIRRGGERFWRHSDFADLPPAAVSQALSRLARRGDLERVGKGLYYRPQPTVLGASRPAPDAVAVRSSARRLHPAGLTAANYLGFTTQNPAFPEYASSAAAVPSALKHAHVRTRRPRNRDAPDREGERDPRVAARPRTHERPGRGGHVRPASRHPGRPALVRAPVEGCPRRAAAGTRHARRGRRATGDGPPPAQTLRASLNPLSRYDFGTLKCLPAAGDWQATRDLEHCPCDDTRSTVSTYHAGRSWRRTLRHRGAGSPPSTTRRGGASSREGSACHEARGDLARQS